MTDADLPGLAIMGDLGRLRVHRPGRRAVIEIDDRAGGCFVKVVRPSRTATIRDRYERLAPTGAVPAIQLADEHTGVLVLSKLSGTTLASTLADGAATPSPRTVIQAARRIWAVGAAPGDAPRSARADAAFHASRIADRLPHLAGRLAELLATIGSDRAVPDATVHGDLNPRNIIVTGRSVAGFVDLDRSAPGDPADDVATLAAHLEAVAILRPASEVARGALAFRDGLLAAAVAEQGSAGSDFPCRVAAVLVGLATEPLRLARQDAPALVAAHVSAAEAWTRNEAASWPPRTTFAGPVSRRA